jgi:hypothetical protein
VPNTICSSDLKLIKQIKENIFFVLHAFFPLKNQSWSLCFSFLAWGGGNVSLSPHPPTALPTLSILYSILLKKKKNNKLVPSVVLHTRNPSTQRLRQKDCEFEASLGYTVS